MDEDFADTTIITWGKHKGKKLKDIHTNTFKLYVDRNMNNSITLITYMRHKDDYCKLHKYLEKRCKNIKLNLFCICNQNEKEYLNLDKINWSD